MKKLLSFLLLVAVLTVGCASGTSFIRPESAAPAEGEQILILPAAIDGLPGDELAQSAALFGGVISAFGDTGISLQPIQPVLESAGWGNFARTLAWGMYHMVTYHDVYDFSLDAGYHGGASEYQMVLEGMGSFVSTVATALELDFNPKYIAVPLVRNTNSIIPGALKVQVMIGLYNIEAEMIDRFIILDETIPAESEAVLASLATMGDKLYSALYAQ